LEEERKHVAAKEAEIEQIGAGKGGRKGRNGSSHEFAYFYSNHDPHAKESILDQEITKN